MPGILGLSLPKGQIEEAWRSSQIWKEAREDLCIFLCVCFSVQNMEHPYDTVWEASNKMAAGSHFGWKVRGMKNNMYLALFSMPALCSWHGDLFFLLQVRWAVCLYFFILHGTSVALHSSTSLWLGTVQNILIYLSCINGIERRRHISSD